MFRSSKAFTLIELLIVVAIIAILAAIAVPNFLEAQVRAKVSRVKTDMRSLATAIGAYDVDNSAVPQFLEMFRLSTPISYITQGVLPDPFGGTDDVVGPDISVYFYTPLDDRLPQTQNFFNSPFMASATDDEKARLLNHRWLLTSNGPDRQLEVFKYPPAGVFLLQLGTILTEHTRSADDVYDPTNGTVSEGDIERSGHGIVDRVF